MSVADLEIELRRRRDPDGDHRPSNAVALTTEEALAIRNAGNIPDELGRSLRLVLFVDGEELSLKRLAFEPDFHQAPAWRREGSKPVNVVPLQVSTVEKAPRPGIAWWEQPDVQELEASWRETGAVQGLVVPAAYRSFVFKTVASLRSAGAEITVEAILDSVARWLAPHQVAELRAALREANP
ncbi:MAG: hypothetical protein M3N53_14915 [Actinomycetota bacterium]|nr:hypothetical protein [Actinomycetota bacterium]